MRREGTEERREEMRRRRRKRRRRRRKRRRKAIHSDAGILQPLAIRDPLAL